jgi:ketosteroid isomerase-like protein
MAGGTLVSACASETVELPPPAPIHWQSSTSTAASPTTPTQKERAVTDAYTKALVSPHVAALGPLLDDEVVFAFGARNSRGREKVMKQHDAMFGAFDDRRIVASRIWLTDSTQTINSQAFEWTMTGVQAREWMGVAPTRKPVTIQGLTLLWATDDGVITELHVYFDEDLVKAQLGAGPVDLRRLPAPAVPAGAPQMFERSGSPQEKANIATFRAMLQALEDNQESAFLATMSDDVGVFTLDEEPRRGKDEARGAFRTLRRAVRQLDTVVENAWGVGGFGVVEYAITGLQIAPLHRISLAGSGGLHPLHSQYADIVELRGGKIARIWRYSDPVSFPSL